MIRINFGPVIIWHNWATTLKTIFYCHITSHTYICNLLSIPNTVLYAWFLLSVSTSCILLSAFTFILLSISIFSIRFYTFSVFHLSIAISCILLSISVSSILLYTSALLLLTISVYGYILYSFLHIHTASAFILLISVSSVSFHVHIGARSFCLSYFAPVAGS